jgi:DMSO/TMAO reductase YedYZ molybdopterin-dependent catalytic subunit
VKKKIFPMFLLVLALGLLFSMFLKSSFDFEVYAANTVTEGSSEWTLRIGGAVSNPINLTLNELIAMPRISVYAELYCYGRLVTRGVWTGVQLSYVLEKAEVDQQAKSLTFYAKDGYTIDLSITTDALLAYEIDGQPLAETLRLVLPRANGDRWIAMITYINVSTSAPSPSQPATSIFTNMPRISQSSPTPTPSPTPQPTPSPSPSPAPSLSPTPTPPNPKPFPITWTVTAVATVTLASAGLIVLFKKRSK